MTKSLITFLLGWKLFVRFVCLLFRQSLLKQARCTDRKVAYVHTVHVSIFVNDNEFKWNTENKEN